MTPEVTCIYHKDCVDGTAAAAVVLRKFPQAKCFALSHRYIPADIEAIMNETGATAHVYIVDSTLGVQEFLERDNEVTVLDHHIGSHEEMRTLAEHNPTLTYVFDNDKCGTSLAWSYLFPDEPVPELITYIEDSDLWRQQFGTVTKDVVHYLSIHLNEPEVMLGLIEAGAEEVKARGKIISEYTDKGIERLIEFPPIRVRIGEWSVLAFNITDHQSACGNILATRHNEAVGLFAIKGEQVRWSFRSLDHQRPSSLELAQALGGGGHRNASGAEMPLSDFVRHILPYEGTQ